MQHLADSMTGQELQYSKKEVKSCCTAKYNITCAGRRWLWHC